MLDPRFGGDMACPSRWLRCDSPDDNMLAILAQSFRANTRNYLVQGRFRTRSLRDSVRRHQKVFSGGSLYTPLPRPSCCDALPGRGSKLFVPHFSFIKQCAGMDHLLRASTGLDTGATAAPRASNCYSCCYGHRMGKLMRTFFLSFPSPLPVLLDRRAFQEVQNLDSGASCIREPGVASNNPSTADAPGKCFCFGKPRSGGQGCERAFGSR